MRMAVQDEVPAVIRDLSPMTADYVDVVTTALPEDLHLPAEQWARIAMEGAHPLGRFLCWQALLRLRLAPGPTPQHVAGWRIVECAEQFIRVEARSPFMTAHIVFCVASGALSFATFVRYDRAVGAVIWPAVAHVHRAVAPRFVRGAVARAVAARGVAEVAP